ncbi:HD family phosphohydrolase [Clostridia bacterium]|nr:HD family phosphohydrolase [Clostridia bacterium]
MTIRIDQLIRAIGAALDIVEGELLGASTNHGKRIAALCAAMARHLKLADTEVSAVATCALFHDSALTETPVLALHCEIGQRNAELLPLDSDIEGFVLYHHEHAGGGGTFGKREGEYPLGAELIAIADMLDVENHMQRVHDLTALRHKARHDPRFTKRASSAMLSVLDGGMLEALRDERIEQTALRLIPAWNIDVDGEGLMNVAALAAHIIDYKSAFTRRHTTQIAERALRMGEHYGYTRDENARLYLAAALHDIGKLATPTSVLEKPGRLTDEEFVVIKEHVTHTHKLLRGIEGFEDICRWAGNHHEKLDGTGYPLGLKAPELDFNSRLLACIDIYQAVSEARPYHGERSHEETMPILYDMAQKGFIEPVIIGDLDKVMAT